jgi:hypothetical protein
MQPTDQMRAGFVTPPTVESHYKEMQKRPDMQYIPHIPWDIRFHRWVRSWIITPRDTSKDNKWLRISRVKFWVFGRASGGNGLYERFRQMTFALLGGFVQSEEYATRMEECMKCLKLQVKIPAREHGKWQYFCGSCGCPRWWLAELHKKNKLRKWNCPEGRHPGPSILSRLRQRVNEEKKRRGVQ